MPVKGIVFAGGKVLDCSGKPLKGQKLKIQVIQEPNKKVNAKIAAKTVTTDAAGIWQVTFDVGQEIDTAKGVRVTATCPDGSTKSFLAVSTRTRDADAILALIRKLYGLAKGGRNKVLDAVKAALTVDIYLGVRARTFRCCKPRPKKKGGGQMLLQRAGEATTQVTARLRGKADDDGAAALVLGDWTLTVPVRAGDSAADVLDALGDALIVQAGLPATVYTDSVGMAHLAVLRGPEGLPVDGAALDLDPELGFDDAEVVAECVRPEPALYGESGAAVVVSRGARALTLRARDRASGARREITVPLHAEPSLVEDLQGALPVDEVTVTPLDDEGRAVRVEVFSCSPRALFVEGLGVRGPVGLVVAGGG